MTPAQVVIHDRQISCARQRLTCVAPNVASPAGYKASQPRLGFHSLPLCGNWISWHFPLSTISRRYWPHVQSHPTLFSICPTIHLIDENGVYCTGHCTPGDGACPISKSWIRNPPPIKHRFVHIWRSRVAEALQACNAFVTTSEAARAVVVDHFPFVADGRLCILEHGRDREGFRPSATAPREGKPIRVVLIGALGFDKGLRLVGDLIRLNAERKGPFEFHFLGEVHGEFDAEKLGGRCHHAYAREDLPERLAAIAPSFSIVASQWPETYCHTLTESWLAGIPVLASKIGTIEERVSKSGGGWLLDPRSAETWFAEMQRIVADPADYARRIGEIERMKFKSVAQMAAEYAEIYASLVAGAVVSAKDFKSAAAPIQVQAPVGGNARVKT